MAEALNAGRHMQFSWLTKPRSEAIRDSLDALNALETLAQPAGRACEQRRGSSRRGRSTTIGCRDVSFWTAGTTSTSRSRLPSGCGRARCSKSGNGDRAPVDASTQPWRRAGVLREIAAIQRTLMDPALRHPARHAARSPRGARGAGTGSRSPDRRLARRGPRADPTFASLDDVQSALAPTRRCSRFRSESGRRSRALRRRRVADRSRAIAAPSIGFPIVALRAAGSGLHRPAVGRRRPRSRGRGAASTTTSSRPRYRSCHRASTG